MYLLPVLAPQTIVLAISSIGMVSYHPQLPPHLDLLNHNMHILRFIKISWRFPAFSKPLFPIASQLGPQAMGKQRQAIPTVLAEFLTHDCDREA